jgi:hypothetical protein
VYREREGANNGGSVGVTMRKVRSTFLPRSIDGNFHSHKGLIRTHLAPQSNYLLRQRENTREAFKIIGSITKAGIVGQWIL